MVGCVTLCVRTAEGFPLVTALFVTVCDSAAEAEVVFEFPVKTGALTLPVAVVTGETPVDVFDVTSFVPLLVDAAATALPVNVGAEFVPVGVTVCVWLG